MFCINCFQKNTKVVNSRAHKKHASVWRRRKCNNCDTVFTTLERPSLAQSGLIASTNGPTPFNLGILVVSIAEAFKHSPDEGKTHAIALAETVETILASQLREISSEDIEATTHQVLKRFDELAALQYAAKHRLIAASSSRRRGRPPVAPSGPL